MKCQLICCVLFVFCAFEVRGGIISNLKIFANYAAEKSLGYDQTFFNSLIQMLSNIRNLTTYSLSDTWNSTRILFNNANKSAETNEQRKCIAAERKNFSTIVDGVAIPLFKCGRSALEFGNPIRKKVQKMHKTSMKIINDLQLIENNCTSAQDKDDCNPLQVGEMETALNTLLKQLTTFQIEGDTMKLVTLSHTLECKSKVLTDVYNEVLDIQKRLKECIKQN